MRRILLALVLSTTTSFIFIASARGQAPTLEAQIGSAFTYQGQLKVHGEPYNGPADFQFTLHSDVTGTALLGDGMLSLNNVVINDGLLTVDLDFGANVFNGARRWLQIAVRTPAGVGSFMTLSPRQPLMPAPYAQFALSGNAGAQGPAGPIGPAGPQGPAGADGTDGAVGPQGPAGADGAMGLQGLQGSVGLQGPQGPAGADGAQGPIGLQGPQGDVGPQGPAGTEGAQGTDGAQGPAGPQGEVGPQGAAGADGAQGPQGEPGQQGPPGADGVPGLQGEAGPEGEVGPQGPAGLQGETGPQGPAGATGPQGLQGAVGPQGPAGADGAQGLQGLQGPAGTPAVVSLGTGTVYGTATLSFSNSSSTSTYTAIPGLTKTIDVPADSIVLITSTGGVSVDGTSSSNEIQVEVALFIDNVEVTQGSPMRVTADNRNSVDNGTGVWTYAQARVLSAGTHTIDLRARRAVDLDGAMVSGDDNSYRQGTLNVVILKTQ